MSDTLQYFLSAPPDKPDPRFQELGRFKIYRAAYTYERRNCPCSHIPVHQLIFLETAHERVCTGGFAPCNYNHYQWTRSLIPFFIMCLLCEDVKKNVMRPELRYDR